MEFDREADVREARVFARPRKRFIPPAGAEVGEVGPDVEKAG